MGWRQVEDYLKWRMRSTPEMGKLALIELKPTSQGHKDMPHKSRTKEHIFDFDRLAAIYIEEGPGSPAIRPSIP